jgi:hypothetical protein
MPAGFIAYRGVPSFRRETELTWNKKPWSQWCFSTFGRTRPCLFSKRNVKKLTCLAPYNILGQCMNGAFPFGFISKKEHDHVLSFSTPFSGYNTAEIQTFVRSLWFWGSSCEMKTNEKKLVAHVNIAWILSKLSNFSVQLTPF